MVQTKEEQRLKRKIAKVLMEYLEMFFGDGAKDMNKESLIKIRELKLEHNLNLKDFLHTLDLEYVVKRDAGEYNNFYFLDRDFTCLVVVNDAE